MKKYLRTYFLFSLFLCPSLLWATDDQLTANADWLSEYSFLLAILWILCLAVLGFAYICGVPRFGGLVVVFSLVVPLTAVGAYLGYIFFQNHKISTLLSGIICFLPLLLWLYLELKNGYKRKVSRNSRGIGNINVSRITGCK